MATESQPPEKSRKKPNLASVLVPVVGILAVTLVALGYLRGKEGGHAHEQGEGSIRRVIGEQLPDFTLKTLEGKSVKVSELKAKVLLINFWATWCTPCVKEMPSLQKLSDEYSSKGLQVIGVDLDENPEVVLESFRAKHQIKFPSYVDTAGELADRFNVSGLPLTLVIDGKRKLLFEQVGDEDWYSPSLRKQFELWLEEAGRE